MKLKEFLIVSIMLFVTISSNAQIKMNSSGNVGINESDPNSKFAVEGPGFDYATAYIRGNSALVTRTLQVGHYPIDEDFNYGIVSVFNTSSIGWKLRAIYGSAYRSSYQEDQLTYGVFGIAGNGEDGYNYGVTGKLKGNYDGAGILGLNSSSYESCINGDYAGYFIGDVKIVGDCAATTWDGSDINLKKDVRNIEDDVISRLSQLNVIKYKLKHPSELEDFSESDTSDIYKDIDSEKYTSDRIGLIAQELQVTFPEVVKPLQDGYLGVNYDQIIPILVKAIKDQQTMIQELSQELESLMSDDRFKSALSTNDIDIDESNLPLLYQNKPNPFNTDTEINFYIPEDKNEAVLFIYNIQGSQIRSSKLLHRGFGTEIINGSELEPGMYLYTLVVDGQEVGTRRMILTD